MDLNLGTLHFVIGFFALNYLFMLWGFHLGELIRILLQVIASRVFQLLRSLAKAEFAFFVALEQNLARASDVRRAALVDLPWLVHRLVDLVRLVHRCLFY